MQLEGLHHISAITGDARTNLDFYTGVLGLRLIAKTVNQDDPSVYHLFYGDEEARPGADLTFFEYPNAIPGRPGAGMVHTIVSRVSSPAAIDFWEGRLAAHAVATERSPDGTELSFADPEGLRHALTVTDRDTPLRAHHPDIPAEHALGGFDGVRAYSAHPDGSRALLAKVLDAAEIEDGFEIRGEVRGATIAFDPAPQEPGRQSAGTVHHIAWGTSAAEHPRWEAFLNDHRIPNSGLVDRHYFHSIYFREPGGVLYEIADDAPGFTVDDPLEDLGKRIILPPQLESTRAKAEARLTPLPDPRASWQTASS